MTRGKRGTRRSPVGASGGMVSRRTAVRVGLGLLAGSAFAQEGIDQERLKASREETRERTREAERGAMEKAYNRMLERRPESRAFFEQMNSGGTPEERMKAMRDWQYQHVMENFKTQLGVSDEEWAVIQPRMAAVYNLKYPPASFAKEDASASGVASRLTMELRELLNNKEAKREEIKARLTALRAAKEKVRQELMQARQGLRQILTVRQEAVLVLADLLD